MNVIIIAACIPSLRPIFLVLFRRPGASNFRASVRERGHPSYYYRTSDSERSKRATTGISATARVFDKRALGTVDGSTEDINPRNTVDDGDAIQVESREVGSRDGEIGEREWGDSKDAGV